MGASISTGDAVLDRVGRHSHWALRIGLASIFVFHGIDKFLGSGITGFASVMGLPWLIGLLVALAELGSGVLIVVGGLTNGWITRLGALGMMPVLLGAIFMEHWGQWHFMATASHPLGGMQFQVFMLLVALYLFVRGNEV